jgi:sugar lactone lactonase YvrE
VVTGDGSVRQVADDLAFANGMLVTGDSSTLIVAESYAKRLTAFDVTDGGALINRRVWADLGDGVPDGICLDGEGAVWYADVPNNAACVSAKVAKSLPPSSSTEAASPAHSAARIEQHRS